MLPQLATGSSRRVAEVGQEGAVLAVGDRASRGDGAVAAGGGEDDVRAGEGSFEVGGGSEAEVGGGEAGRGVEVADLDDGAEGAGRVGGAAPDGTVADDEDRLAVQGEAGHVQEGVSGHEADQVPVVQALL